MKVNVLLDKSFAFAVRVVRAYKYLVDEKKGFVLSKQFLRSGTSIGANAEEAIGGQSRPDFVAKMNIAYKKREKLIIGYASYKPPIISLKDKPKAC